MMPEIPSTKTRCGGGHLDLPLLGPFAAANTFCGSAVLPKNKKRLGSLGAFVAFVAFRGGAHGASGHGEDH